MTLSLAPASCAGILKGAGRSTTWQLENGVRAPDGEAQASCQNLYEDGKIYVRSVKTFPNPCWLETILAQSLKDEGDFKCIKTTTKMTRRSLRLLPSDAKNDRILFWTQKPQTASPAWKVRFTVFMNPKHQKSHQSYSIGRSTDDSEIQKKHCWQFAVKIPRFFDSFKRRRRN